MAAPWEHKFSGEIDKNLWNFETGNGPENNPGWGNGEKQYYRAENARIENEHLIIEARREDFEGFPFTSAKMTTQGHMEFKYGTLEIRVRTPAVGNGLWPAIWMLGSEGDGWPKCGEIDIMESGVADAIANNTVNRVIGAALHWWEADHQADHGQGHTAENDLNSDFHTYKLIWDPEFIRVSIDDQQFFEMNVSDREGKAAFHKKFYLIFNVAVCGQYTGIDDPGQVTAPLPAKMEVEYIRLNPHPDGELFISGQKV